MNYEEEAVSPSESEAAVPSAHRDLVVSARRHPATIALIDEISAQVSARADRRIEMAKAELHAEMAEVDGLFGRRDLMILGGFATVNLLLVTVVLGLGYFMTPWLAGLVVSTITFGAVVTAVRVSTARPERMSFIRRLGARRFVERLFASI